MPEPASHRGGPCPPAFGFAPGGGGTRKRVASPLNGSRKGAAPFLGQGVRRSDLVRRCRRPFVLLFQRGGRVNGLGKAFLRISAETFPPPGGFERAWFADQVARLALAARRVRTLTWTGCRVGRLSHGSSSPQAPRSRDRLAPKPDRRETLKVVRCGRHNDVVV